jgi:FAD/FMN-containing dehydrogenase
MGDVMGIAGTRVAERLREVVRGRVLNDQDALNKFARDRSIYDIRPMAVVLPEDVEDIQRLLEFSAREGLPVTPRGGGSGLAGSALGQGVVIALPQNDFWAKISDFSETSNSAKVSASAGVYHNELQKFLNERGFFLPADVTSAEISRIGGNIATKASGPHALKYGSIDRFLEQVEFVTAGGELVDTGDERTIPTRFRKGLADLERKIRASAAARGLLEKRMGLKTASGYNLFAFLKELSTGELVGQLLAGSVGTLGFITRATLRGEVLELDRAAVLLFFDDLPETGRAVISLREMDVASIELISRDTIHVISEQASVPKSFLVDAHILFVELTGPDRQSKIEQITKHLEKRGLTMSSPPVIAMAENEIEKLWKLRKQVLWFIEHAKPGIRALTVVNDVAVPPERLAEFISDAQKVFTKHGMAALMYGHAGNGNLHLRPLFDMSLPDLAGRIQRLVDDVYEAVFLYDGTMTAEHGMGRLRAPYLKREWGDALYTYMREVKTIFDPHDMLNPGTMFSDAPITDNIQPDLLKQ